MYRPPTKVVDNAETIEVFFFDKLVGHQDVAVQPLHPKKMSLIPMVMGF